MKLQANPNALRVKLRTEHSISQKSCLLWIYNHEQMKTGITTHYVCKLHSCMYKKHKLQIL